MPNDIHCETECRLDLLNRFDRVCSKIGKPVQQGTVKWFFSIMLVMMSFIWGISATVYSNAQKKDEAAIAERVKLIEKNERLSQTNRDLISQLKVQNANIESWMTFISKQIEYLSDNLKELRSLDDKIQR